MGHLRVVVIESDDAESVLPVLHGLFQPPKQQGPQIVMMPAAVQPDPPPANPDDRVTVKEEPRQIEAKTSTKPEAAAVAKNGHAEKMRQCARCTRVKPLEAFAGGGRGEWRICIDCRGGKAQQGERAEKSGDPTQQAFLYVEECMKSKTPIDPEDVRDLLPDHYGDGETRRFIQQAMERVKLAIA